MKFFRRCLNPAVLVLNLILSSSSFKVIKHNYNRNFNKKMDTITTTTMDSTITTTTITKPIVAVDIDEVLANFIPTLATFHNDVYESSLTAESFVSYEFHLVWGGSKEECSLKMEEFFQSKYFYNDILPVEDAYHNLLELKEMFELHIVTARQHKVAEVTRNWVNKHYPNVFTDIHFGNHYSTTGISKSKAQLCKEINAIMLIDDSPAYAVNCAENQIPVILFGDYSWNREYLKDKIAQLNKYVKRANSWKEVKDLAINIYNNPINNDNIFNHDDSSLIVAAIQMTSINDKTINIAKIEKLVNDAADMGAMLICLPECCCFIGTNITETIENAEDIINGDTITKLKSLAKARKIWLSVGSIHEQRKDVNRGTKISNTQLLIDPEGDIVSSYRKVHLFDSPFSHLFESKSTIPGQDVVCHNIGNGLILGMTICYDLRFPELFRALTREGANCILVPAAFTAETGLAHWEVLLRARAIEHQCYIIASAQCGIHNGTRKSYGKTMIVDPWGKILSECKEFDVLQSSPNASGVDNDMSRWDGISISKINRKIIDDIREKMPVLEHVKNDIYRLFSK